ncbi:hypothetical protein H4S02_002090 [Coemansia sp. RSA 2611]|nr:hypothetical protein H4S02_002090 [Coemansia sp. RSA 2611]
MDEPLFGGVSRREILAERFATTAVLGTASATLAAALVQSVRAGDARHALLGVTAMLLAAIEAQLIAWYRRGDLEPRFRRVIGALGASVCVLCVVANLYFFT